MMSYDESNFTIQKGYKTPFAEQVTYRLRAKFSAINNRNALT